MFSFKAFALVISKYQHVISIWTGQCHFCQSQDHAGQRTITLLLLIAWLCVHRQQSFIQEWFTVITWNLKTLKETCFIN